MHLGKRMYIFSRVSQFLKICILWSETDVKDLIVYIWYFREEKITMADEQFTVYDADTQQIVINQGDDNQTVHGIQYITQDGQVVQVRIRITLST